jgi:hypothetical protein
MYFDNEKSLYVCASKLGYGAPISRNSASNFKMVVSSGFPIAIGKSFGFISASWRTGVQLKE